MLLQGSFNSHSYSVFSATNLLKPLNFDRYLSQLYREKFRFFFSYHSVCIIFFAVSPVWQRGEPKCVRDEAYSYKTHKHQPAHNIKYIKKYVAAAAQGKRNKKTRKKSIISHFCRFVFSQFHFSFSFPFFLKY